MKIGIDISQIVYEGTGVGKYVRSIVEELLKLDAKNEYVLFGSSLRRRQIFYQYFQRVKYIHSRVRLVVFPLPPAFLDLLWNRLHLFPIELLIGDVDLFWSSDWTQPPLRRARGISTIHDVSFMKYPETFTNQIIEVQKRRLRWVKRECRRVFCDSEATKEDAIQFFGIEKEKLRVVYPGFRYIRGRLADCKATP